MKMVQNIRIKINFNQVIYTMLAGLNSSLNFVLHLKKTSAMELKFELHYDEFPGWFFSLKILRNLIHCCKQLT